MRPVTSSKKDLLPIDDLDRAIIGIAGRINAATYELLILVRQFDERAGWLKWGLATAFSSGKLSYSKVRPLTRIARPDNEEKLVDFARKTTAARVEERCRELRYGTVNSVDEANRAHASRSLRTHRDISRGTMTFTVELPLETGELLEKAIDRARDATASKTPELVDERWAAQQADGLVTIPNAYLSRKGDSSTHLLENYQVTVHVDRSALANGDGRSGLPIESVKRLCCDGDAVVIVEDEHGEPLSIGRKTRTVPTAIKRALRARDKGCSFPDCKNKRFIDAHHIRHWCAGGETSLDNLMLLCPRHHRLAHEGGFRIERDYKDRWFFKRPDGRAVPTCGYLAHDVIDDDMDEFSKPPNNPAAEGFAVSSLPLGLEASLQPTE